MKKHEGFEGDLNQLYSTHSRNFKHTKKSLAVIVSLYSFKVINFESSKTILDTCGWFLSSEHIFLMGVVAEISRKNEKRCNTKSWLNVAQQQMTTQFLGITKKRC